MIDHEIPMNRRRFIRSGAAWMVAGAMASRASSARAATPAPFDITFFQMGDPHYLAFDESTKGGVKINPVIRENLKLMMQLKPDTAMPGGHGTVGKALGLIDVGDCIEAGGETDPATGQAIGGGETRVRQWENYVADLGLTGTEKDILIDIPIYEGYGNHDQDGFVQGIIDRISARNKNRVGVTAVSGKFEYPQGERYAGVVAEGLHYAWKWGPVHFIQANIRVGDSFDRYPAAGSYTFVEDYLKKAVGVSGAPVMIAMHLPPNSTGEGDWPAADRQRFYELIKGYNIIGLLCGHSHSYNIGEWRGPDNQGSVAVPVYRCDTVHRSAADGGFMSVFRIKSSAGDPKKADLVIARRMRDNTWADTHRAEIAVGS
jgi:cytolysin (calcineurin-like family phosphatase)